MIVNIERPTDDDKQIIDIQVEDHDLWNIDQTLAHIILPLLKDFRNFDDSYPACYEHQQWREIIDKMIHTFELIIEDEYSCDIELTKEIQEGLDLFGQNYLRLWT